MSIEMSRLTLDDLLKQLEQARQIAIEERKPTAMIQATATMARLIGLDKPILKDVTPNSQREPLADYSKLNDNELRQLAALTEKVEVTRVIVDPIADTKERY